jgi:competence protein ComEC
VAAAAYTLIAGYAVPSQRTLIMLTVVGACVLADRHTSPSRVLALAALAVLAIDPWAVLSPGFWLSFGAVGAIFWCVALRTGNPSAIHGATAAQLAVTVAMLPMLLALFQEVSLVSPLANAFAIPVVSLVVVPLTLAGIFLPVPALLDVAHLVMEWVMVPLEWLASLSGAVLESHEPGALPVACAVAGGLWLLAPRGVPMRWAGALWFLPIFLVMPPAPPAGAVWIDMLDVGQGLATVVRTAAHALVYDAGPYWNADSDSGSRIVVPFLRGEGVRRLDALVVTHADEDHSGGAISVATARRPEWILSTLGEDDALHLHAPLSRLCIAGLAWEWDGVGFEVLHPGALAFDDRRRRENDRACTIRVSAGGGAVLLTSDAERLAEAEMLERGRGKLRADVLLVPHHGSRTSSTPAFLDAVAPSVALVSVGYRNRFRHPNPAVEASYRARGIAILRTDLAGAVHLEVPAEGKSPMVITTQSQRPRYWSDRRPGG